MEFNANFANGFAPHVGSGSIDGIDTSYDRLLGYSEKSQFLLDDGENMDCGVCKAKLDLEDDLIVVCPTEVCRCAFHILCLSSIFLQQDSPSPQLIPREGICPGCQCDIEWSVMIKEMTLRIRGENKDTRVKRKNATKSAGGMQYMGTEAGPKTPIHDIGKSGGERNKNEFVDLTNDDRKRVGAGPNDNDLTDNSEFDFSPMQKKDGNMPRVLTSKRSSPIHDTGWDDVVVLD